MSCGIPYLNIGNLSSLASCTLQCIAIDGLTANLAPALYPMHNRKGLCALVPSISQNGIVPVQPATYRSNLLKLRIMQGGWGAMTLLSILSSMLNLLQVTIWFF